MSTSNYTIISKFCNGKITFLVCHQFCKIYRRFMHLKHFFWDWSFTLGYETRPQKTCHKKIMLPFTIPFRYCYVRLTKTFTKRTSSQQVCSWIARQFPKPLQTEILKYLLKISLRSQKCVDKKADIDFSKVFNYALKLIETSKTGIVVPSASNIVTVVRAISSISKTRQEPQFLHIVIIMVSRNS